MHGFTFTRGGCQQTLDYTWGYKYEGNTPGGMNANGPCGSWGVNGDETAVEGLGVNANCYPLSGLSTSANW